MFSDQGLSPFLQGDATSSLWEGCFLLEMLLMSFRLVSVRINLIADASNKKKSAVKELHPDSGMHQGWLGALRSPFEKIRRSTTISSPAGSRNESNNFKSHSPKQ